MKNVFYFMENTKQTLWPTQYIDKGILYCPKYCFKNMLGKKIGRKCTSLIFVTSDSTFIHFWTLLIFYNDHEKM